MSNVVIALCCAVSIATWVFTKLNHKVGGGDMRPVVIGSVASGAGIFLFVYATLAWVLGF